MRKVFLLFSIILLTACTLPGSSTGLGHATNTPEDQPCYFNWDTQPLPDISAQVQKAMQSASLKGITVKAEAYGESCYDAHTKEPLSFGAMETDFYVDIQVESLTDNDQLGNLLEQILKILDNFPVGATPGPEPGYINVTFHAGSEQQALMFTAADGESARALGLHGSSLLEKLQNK